MLAPSASHSRDADSTSVSSTVCRSKRPRLISLRMSAAARSASSRCLTSVTSWPTASTRPSGNGLKVNSTSAAVAGAPRVAAAVRIADARGALGHDLLDVDIGAIVAALGHVADAVEAGRAGPADLVRVAMEFQQLAVDELDVEILVEQLDGLVHVVEHGLHRLPRPLGIGARGLGRLLGGGERRLALFQLGDVAVDADDRAVVERLVADLDVVAAGRGPLEANAARHLQMIDQLFDLGLDVVDLAEIAAPDLEAADVAHHASRETRRRPDSAGIPSCAG